MYCKESQYNLYSITVADNILCEITEIDNVL